MMLLLSALMAAQAAAANAVPMPPSGPRPIKELGAREPWQGEELMPGDEWTDVILTIDKRGYVKDCHTRGGTITGENQRGYICMAFVRDWRTNPIMRDGQPVEIRIRRRFVLRGTRGASSDEQARHAYKTSNRNTKSTSP